MRFEKVSLEQYLKDAAGDSMYCASSGNKNIPESFRLNLGELYEDIKLPKRGTKKSAGYDFFAPYDITLWPGDTIRLATGIRVLLEDDKYLMCVPRSGLGFKFRIQLDNTVAIIDADYSDAPNEGHIMLKLTNDCHDSRKPAFIKKGDGICQGIISKYYTTEDDDTDAARIGGFGSTTKEDN